MFAYSLIVAQMGHPPASDGGGGFNWFLLFNPAVVWIFIPVVAILVGAMAKIIQRTQEHRERMAMIAAGLHPDYPPDEAPNTNTEANLRETTAHFS